VTSYYGHSGQLAMSSYVGQQLHFIPTLLTYANCHTDTHSTSTICI